MPPARANDRRRIPTARSRHNAKTQVPLHERIAARLRRDLSGDKYAPGDRFASQNELARLHHTSPITAREAVATLVNEGLLERRFGSGTYVTARRAETFVAIVIELDISHPATSPSFLRIIQSTRRELEAAGKRTRVYIGHAAPFDVDRAYDPRITSPEFWIDLDAGRIEGLAVIGTDPWAGYNAVAGRDIPVVNSDECDGVPYVDRTELVRLGAQALAARGCRTAACIEHTKSPDRHGTLDLFKDEIERCGMRTRPQWLVPAPIVHERGAGAAAFLALWQSRKEKPDGLLVLDDVLYRDLAPALLLNHIRVPRDLVVASQTCAEDPHSFVPEPIRLEIDNGALGVSVAKTLLARMRNPQAPPEGIPIPIRVVQPTGRREAELTL